MFTVYVLKSLNFDKSYVGSCKDLDKRIREHNRGKSIFSKRYMPWEVIYTEKYDTLKEARLREKYLKSRSGRRWLKNNIFD